jgi:uncharacterized iron-regulated membrane protein
MKWFRQHVKQGSRLALFALAVQFALSFGHFHGTAAQAAPAIQTARTQADPADARSLVIDAANESAQQQQPANSDNDRQPADDACAICAVIALAGNGLFATPPVLLLPQAAELLYLATHTGFVHLNPAHPAFQSRAPPNS